MCSRTTCSSCGRPTYAGCGQHVEQVLGDVPAADRCQCRAVPNVRATAKAGRSWFRRS